MGEAPAQCGEATEAQIERFRGLAIRDLIEAGFEEPSEQAIQSRLRTLVEKNNSHLTGSPQSGGADPRPSPGFSPGLALVQDFCQKRAHEADLRTSAKRRGQSVAHGEGRIPYYFAALPDEYIDHFARFLPPSAALIVWTLYRYGKTDMQTWVSQDTLAEKAGICENTLKRDMGLLIGCKVVQRGTAGGTDFDGNPIGKFQGYKYRLNVPLAWDKERVKQIRWRKPKKAKKRRKPGCG